MTAHCSHSSFLCSLTRLQKRQEEGGAGADVGLLEEDTCSVSSSDERQLLRQPSAAVSRPPTSARALNAAESAV